MSLSVRDRAHRIATFRYVEVRLMETLAAWTPRVPEMEVKVMFGRHIWDFAQHADWLGKRTYELRQPMHHTREPAGPVLDLLEAVANLEDSQSKVHAFYDVVLPSLEAHYRRYLDDTDHLLDAPSVLVIERILAETPRQRRDADALRERLGWSDLKIENIEDLAGRVERFVA